MTAGGVSEATVRKAQAAPSQQNSGEFREGDTVVYQAHGVGRIDRIGAEEIAGQHLEVIQISFLENQMTVRLPLSKAQTAGLRKLSSKAAIDEAIAVMKGRPRASKALWAKRAQEYQGKINSGNPMLLAEVLRDLRRNAGSLEGSFSERQIFETALDRFAAEIAVLNGQDKAKVIGELTEILKQA